MAKKPSECTLEEIAKAIVKQGGFPPDLVRIVKDTNCADEVLGDIDWGGKQHIGDILQVRVLDLEADIRSALGIGTAIVMSTRDQKRLKDVISTEQDIPQLETTRQIIQSILYFCKVTGVVFQTDPDVARSARRHYS